MSFLERFKGKTSHISGHGSTTDPVEKQMFRVANPIEKSGWLDFLRNSRQQEIDLDLKTREEYIKNELSNLDDKQNAIQPKIRANKLLKTYPKRTKLQYRNQFESQNQLLCEQVIALAKENRLNKYLGGHPHPPHPNYIIPDAPSHLSKETPNKSHKSAPIIQKKYKYRLQPQENHYFTGNNSKIKGLYRCKVDRTLNYGKRAGLGMVCGSSTDLTIKTSSHWGSVGWDRGDRGVEQTNVGDLDRKGVGAYWGKAPGYRFQNNGRADGPWGNGRAIMPVY